MSKGLFPARSHRTFFTEKKSDDKAVGCIFNDLKEKNRFQVNPHFFPEHPKRGRKAKEEQVSNEALTDEGCSFVGEKSGRGPIM